MPLDDPSATRGPARDLRTWSPGRTTFEEDGTATSRVPEAGVYRVALELDYEYKPGYHLEAQLALDGATLTISEAGGRYSVGFDAALEGAVAELREDFDRYVDRGFIPGEVAFCEMIPD